MNNNENMDTIGTQVKNATRILFRAFCKKEWDANVHIEGFV